MELFNYQKLIFAENVICRVLEINLGISNYHYNFIICIIFYISKNTMTYFVF